MKRHMIPARVTAEELVRVDAAAFAMGSPGTQVSRSEAGRRLLLAGLGRWEGESRIHAHAERIDRAARTPADELVECPTCHAEAGDECVGVEQQGRDRRTATTAVGIRDVTAAYTGAVPS